MLKEWFWLDTIIKQQKQKHYMHLQMDPLDNPWIIRNIQTAWKVSIKPYLNWMFLCLDVLDCQFGDWLVPTNAKTQSDSLELLLTLILYIVLLCITAFNSFVMSWTIHPMPWLPNMQDQKLLMLGWHLFSWWGKVCVIRWSGCQGHHYIVNESLP